jgi:FtsH-binding integral membrane protein
MEKFGKIIGINLLILIVYSLISNLLGKLDGELTMIMVMVICILIQTGVCFGFGIKKFTESKKQEGGIYLLTCFLVLIIGFGTCTQLSAVKTIPQVEVNTNK